MYFRPGLTATGISGSAWNCTLSTLACTRSDSLAVSASYPAITVNVTTSVTAPGGVTDTVSVAGGGDRNTADNTVQDYTTTFTLTQWLNAWTVLEGAGKLRCSVADDRRDGFGAPVLLA